VRELLRAGRDTEALAAIDTEAAAQGAAGPNPGFREAGGALYWTHRALPEFVRVQHEHLRRLEATLAESTDAAESAALIRAIGGSYYNLASFAWPGWNEEGIVAGDAELAAGRAAAARCLAIRADPAHVAVPFGYSLSTSHWLIGAFHLTDGNKAAAAGQFERARDLAEPGSPEQMLQTGYLALAQLAAQPAERAAEAALAAVLTWFASRKEVEDAASYRDQLVTCRRVLARRAGSTPG